MSHRKDKGVKQNRGAGVKDPDIGFELEQFMEGGQSCKEGSWEVQQGGKHSSK